ncbi:MAG: hypothetical protein WCC70_02130 [Candidatus Aquilonibacter sp.]
MAQLYQRRYLKCPYNRARDLLAQSVTNALQSGEGRLLHLTLAFPPVLGVEIGKDVVVSVKPVPDPMHFDEPWNVHWEPVSGLYPVFDGTLTIRADESYASAILELSGAYEPPLGLAGMAFDAVLGQRIAHETARELLRKLAATIEKQYQVTENEKTAAT